tara:strand:- start:155 stop:463 length:309 start_codon:yes stop_codon:yes gene_type:complete
MCYERAVSLTPLPFLCSTPLDKGSQSRGTFGVPVNFGPHLTSTNNFLYFGGRARSGEIEYHKIYIRTFHHSTRKRVLKQGEVPSFIKGLGHAHSCDVAKRLR